MRNQRPFQGALNNQLPNSRSPKFEIPQLEIRHTAALFASLPLIPSF